MAIANYGVRRFLTEQLAAAGVEPARRVPRHRAAQRLLLPERGRVRLRSGSSSPPGSIPRRETAPALDARGFRPVGRFRFDVDLYRVSDGLLMASCRLQKSLSVPDRDKGLVYESERLLAQIRAGA